MQRYPQTVRVFISSTFRDMHAERDYLTRVVFPELRSRCLERGVEFDGLDLRWGVTREDAEGAGALAVCLDEIERCRPFFLGLLGERYGWIPPPEEIPAEIFEQAADEPAPDSEALQWYTRDDSSAPVVYRLLCDGWIDLEKAERLAEFWEARGLFGAATSITAREILRGVFDDSYPASHGLFYFRRSSIGRDTRLPESLRSEFVEADPRRQAKLNALKDRIRSDGRFRVREYDARFAGFRVDPSTIPADLAQAEREALGTGLVGPDAWQTLKPELRALIEARGTVALDGLEAFGDQVLEDLWQAIESEFGPGDTPRDAHAVDGRYHERFAAERSSVFIGREDSVASVLAYLDAEGSSHPLIVTGPAGSGKSALLARCVEQQRERAPACIVVPFFIGAAPGSTDLTAVLRWLWEALGRIGRLDEAPPTEFGELERRFGDVVRSAVQHRPVVLFIDALNLLAAPMESRLGWLPTELRPGLKIVASVELGKEFERLRSRLPSASFFELPEFVESERAALVAAHLERRRKKLSPGQLALLLDTDSHPDAALPLYLAVAIEELALFGSFDALTERIRRLPPTVAELFDQVLARLDQDHGRELTASVCRWLTTSRSGVLESELLDLLAGNGPGFPKARWIRLYRSLMYYLQPIDEATGSGMLRFNHDQLARAVLRRYLAMDVGDDPSSAEFLATHSELGRYFGSVARQEAPVRWRSDRPRGLSELPYHLACARQWPELKEALRDLGFVEAKAAAGMLAGLIGDYSFALSAMRRADPARLDSAGLGAMARFLRAESQTLTRASELTFQSAANQPDSSLPHRLAVSRLASGAETRPWLRWRNKPGEATDLTMTLKCGFSSAYSCGVSPDAESIAVGGWSGIEVWSTQIGERLAAFDADDAVSYVHYSSAGLWVGSGQFVRSFRTLHLLDPESGNERALRVVTPPAQSLSITADGKRLASLDTDGAVNVINLEFWAPTSRLDAPGAVAIALSSDGCTLFAIAPVGRIETYDTSTGAVVASIDTGVAADGLAVSWDGSILALVRQDVVACFETSSANFLGALESTTAAFEDCAFTPRGDSIVTIARDGTLQVWAPRWLDALREAGHRSPAPAAARSVPSDWRNAARRKSQAAVPVSACAFNAAGDALLIARPGVEIALYAPDRIERTGLLFELDARMPVPSTCGLAPDALHYAFGTGDGRVGLFATDAPQYLPKYLHGHQATVTATVFSPDSTRLATASEDCSLVVWDVVSRSKRHVLRGHAAPVRDCCWTDDEKVLVSVADDSTLCLWDSDAGALLERWELSVPLTSCAYSARRAEIVVGDTEGRISWLGRSEARNRSACLLHGDRVVMCTWVGDDSWVFSAGGDRNIKVFDVATAQTIAMLMPAAPITAAAFHPAGQTGIVCGADGSVMSLALEVPGTVANRSLE